MFDYPLPKGGFKGLDRVSSCWDDDAFSGLEDKACKPLGILKKGLEEAKKFKAGHGTPCIVTTAKNRHSISGGLVEGNLFSKHLQEEGVGTYGEDDATRGAALADAD